MEKIKVIIENKQKTVRIPTGVRLLIRRCCHATLELEGFEADDIIGTAARLAEEVDIEPLIITGRRHDPSDQQ